MKKHAALFLTLICLAIGAGAQTKQPGRAAYAEARKLYDALEKPLNRTMLWEKTTQPQRVEAVKIATELRDRTYKLWGDFSQCSMAAESNLNFVISINQIAFLSQSGSQLRPYDMLRAIREAEEFGNHRAACYDYVEALDTVAKK